MKLTTEKLKAMRSQIPTTGIPAEIDSYALHDLLDCVEEMRGVLTYYSQGGSMSWPELVIEKIEDTIGLPKVTMEIATKEARECLNKWFGDEVKRSE